MEEIINNNKNLRDFIKKMIIETLRIEHVAAEEIDDHAPLFVEGLGLDSIDALELVVAIEKNFSVIIKDEDVGKKAFASVDALAKFIQENKQREA